MGPPQAPPGRGGARRARARGCHGVAAAARRRVRAASQTHSAQSRTRTREHASYGRSFAVRASFSTLVSRSRFARSRFGKRSRVFWNAAETVRVRSSSLERSSSPRRSSRPRSIKIQRNSKSISAVGTALRSEFARLCAETDAHTPAFFFVYLFFACVSHSPR